MDESRPLARQEGQERRLLGGFAPRRLAPRFALRPDALRASPARHPPGGLRPPIGRPLRGRHQSLGSRCAARFAGGCAPPVLAALRAAREVDPPGEGFALPRLRRLPLPLVCKKARPRWLQATTEQLPQQPGSVETVSECADGRDLLVPFPDVPSADLRRIPGTVRPRMLDQLPHSVSLPATARLAALPLMQPQSVLKLPPVHHRPPTYSETTSIRPWPSSWAICSLASRSAARSTIEPPATGAACPVSCW